MAIDNNFIDDLKSRIDIVDIIGREVALKKAGSSYKGLCPFHSEKTPSFSVSEQNQFFHCFGCGEKGDAIAFVRRFYNLTFIEAVEKICEDYNIPMPEDSYSAPKVDYDRYYEINRKAARFFYRNMGGSGNAGYHYIRRRGISDETIRIFGLGYAPDQWSALYDFLHGEGVSDEDMLKLGLIQKGKRGYYDKFRNRVIFPIFNTSGKVIGFGGRALGDTMPKYLNSSESEIFLKKNNLYALNFTRKDIADEDQVLIVEGYMDVVSLYQSGVRNVVASLGTALTENQAKLISRYTKNVILSYDADNAGINAAMRGIDIIRGAGCSVRILRISDGKDPDEFIKKNGKEAFLKLVRASVPAVDFKLDVLKKGLDLSQDLEVLQFIRRCVPVLTSLSPVEQNIYVKKLAQEFSLSEMAIESEIRAGTQQASVLPAQNQGVRETRRRRRQNGGAVLRLELSMILLITDSPDYLTRLQQDGFLFRTALGSKCYAILQDPALIAAAGGMGIDLNRLYERLEPEEETSLRRAAQEIRIGPEEEVFYQDCLARYRLDQYQEQRTELLSDLQIAEKMGDEQEMQKIAEQLMEVE